MWHFICESILKVFSTFLSYENVWDISNIKKNQIKRNSGSHVISMCNLLTVLVITIDQHTVEMSTFSDKEKP